MICWSQHGYESIKFGRTKWIYWEPPEWSIIHFNEFPFICWPTYCTCYPNYIVYTTTRICGRKKIGPLAPIRLKRDEILNTGKSNLSISFTENTHGKSAFFKAIIVAESANCKSNSLNTIWLLRGCMLYARIFLLAFAFHANDVIMQKTIAKTTKE